MNIFYSGDFSCIFRHVMIFSQDVKVRTTKRHPFKSQINGISGSFVIFIVLGKKFLEFSFVGSENP